MITILVLADEQALANRIAEILGEHGCNALPLSDPNEAVEHARQIPFDVAFLGIQIPALTGAHLQLRLESLLPDCRFVLYGTPNAVERASRLGPEFEFLSTQFPEQALAKISQEVESERAIDRREVLERV